MSLFDIELFTNWISQNPDWALLIVFGIAFVESIAVVGLFMPGWLLLVGVGVLIGTGNINFYLASLFCFAGAVLGEYLSFMVGVHYKERVHHFAIFKRHPEWLEKTEHFFQRYGIASIALGQFVGPVRAFAPLLAGMSAMPLLRFQITILIATMIWAPVYLMPGILLGTSVHIEPEVRWILLGNIGLIVISGWFAVSYMKNIWRVRHPEYISTEYDDKHVWIKMLFSMLVFILAMYSLFAGLQEQQFKQLVSLIWQTINQ